jgi:serine/threonine protein kinase
VLLLDGGLLVYRGVMCRCPAKGSAATSADEALTRSGDASQLQLLTRAQCDCLHRSVNSGESSQLPGHARGCALVLLKGSQDIRSMHTSLDKLRFELVIATRLAESIKQQEAPAASSIAAAHSAIVRPQLTELMDSRLALVMPDSAGVPLLTFVSEHWPPAPATTPHDAPSVVLVPTSGSTPLAVIPTWSVASVCAALKAVQGVAEELQRLHACGLVHKAVATNSILYNGSTGRAQFLDLSAASLLVKDRADVDSALLSSMLASIRPWLYCSPEQSGKANRSIDLRSDLYSLGAVLFELLTGRPPFDAEDALELIHLHLAKAPPPILPQRDALSLHTQQPLLYALLEASQSIVHRLLQKQAEDRYQSTAGLIFDLEQVRSAASLPPEPSSNPSERVILGSSSPLGVISAPALHALRAFRVGQVDQVSTFRLSQRLYGRMEQVEQLRKAYESIARDHAHALSTAHSPRLSPCSPTRVQAPQLFVISGYSGVGQCICFTHLFLICFVLPSFSLSLFLCPVFVSQAKRHWSILCNNTSSPCHAAYVSLYTVWSEG